MKERHGALRLVFSRGGKRFAVNADHTSGVEPYPDPARIPNTPPGIIGLIGWRGAILPMIEPGDESHDAATAAIIVSSEGGDLALAADEVAGWHEADAATALEPDEVYHRLRDAVRRAVREPYTQDS